MLSPRALRPLLRYFDALDESVSLGVVAARPHSEIALTADLCSLMDEHEQARYALRHNVAWLRRELRSRLPLADVEFGISNLEYPASLENFVTQSDMGLVVEFRDHIVRGRDWTAAVVLQAKRLYLDTDGRYSSSSTYGAVNKEQAKRIKALHAFLGFNAVRYLLYGPRTDLRAGRAAPLGLDAGLAASLQHVRELNMEGPIFDYAPGLTIHRELTRGKRFVDGGAIVAPVGSVPTNLARTYEGTFCDNLPLPWFLSLMLIESSPDVTAVLPPRLTREQLDSMTISPVDVATGEHAAANAIADRLVELELVSPNVPTFPVLPTRAMRVRVTVADSDSLRDDPFLQTP